MLKRFKKFNLEDINNHPESNRKTASPFPTLSAFMNEVVEKDRQSISFQRKTTNAVDKEKSNFSKQKDKLMSGLLPDFPKSTKGRVSQSLNFNYGVPNSYLEAKRQYYA